MAKGKDPSTQKQSDFDDELSDILSQTENDFGDEKFDLEGIDSEEDRAPAGKMDTMTDTLNHAGKKAAKGAVTGIVSAIENDMPNASNFVNDSLDALGQLNATKDEFLNQVTPVVNETKKIASRLLRQVDDIVPKGIYERLNRFLTNTEQSETTGTPSKADIRKNEMNSAIEALFAGQQQQQMIDRKVDMANRIEDQKLENARHKESASILSSILNQSQFHTSFLRSTYTAYIKKDLEIKFRSLYLQEDLVDVTRIMSQMLEKKLETIRHNTSLPDAQKIYLTELASQKAKEEMIGGFSRWTGRYMERVTKNIKEEWLEPALENLGNLNDMGEMMASMMEDEEEMTGKKFNARRSILGWIAGLGGSMLGKMGVRKFIKKIRPELKDVLEALSHNGLTGLKVLAAKYASGELESLDADGNDTFMATMLKAFGALGGEIDTTAGKLDNDVYKNPSAPGKITRLFTTTVQEVIPGYLSHQLKYLKAIAFGIHNPKDIDKIDVDVFDFKKRRLVSKTEFNQRYILDTYGDVDRRASILKGHTSSILGILDNSIENIDANTYDPNERRKLKDHKFYTKIVKDNSAKVGLVLDNLARSKNKIGIDLTAIGGVASATDDKTLRSALEDSWAKVAFRGMSPDVAQQVARVLLHICTNNDGTPNRGVIARLTDRIMNSLHSVDSNRENGSHEADIVNVQHIDSIETNDKGELVFSQKVYDTINHDISDKDLGEVTGAYDEYGNSLEAKSMFDRFWGYVTSYEFKHALREKFIETCMKLDSVVEWVMDKIKLKQEYNEWKKARTKNIEDLKNWYDKQRLKVQGFFDRVEGKLLGFVRAIIAYVGRDKGEQLANLMFQEFDGGKYYALKKVDTYEFMEWIRSFEWLPKKLGEIYERSSSNLLYWIVFMLLPDAAYNVAKGETITSLKAKDKYRLELSQKNAERSAFNAVFGYDQNQQSPGSKTATAASTVPTKGMYIIDAIKDESKEDFQARSKAMAEKYTEKEKLDTVKSILTATTREFKRLFKEYLLNDLGDTPGAEKIAEERTEAAVVSYKRDFFKRIKEAVSNGPLTSGKLKYLAHEHTKLLKKALESSTRKEITEEYVKSSTDAMKSLLLNIASNNNKPSSPTHSYAEGGTYDPKTGEPINGVHTKAHTFANGNAEIGEHGAETAVPLNGTESAKRAWYTTLQHFLFGMSPRDAAKMSKSREKSLDTTVSSIREYLLKGRTPESVAAEYEKIRKKLKGTLGDDVIKLFEGMKDDGAGAGGGSSGNGGNGGSGGVGNAGDEEDNGGFWSRLFGVKDTDAGKENEETLYKMRGKTKAAKRGYSLGYTTLGTLHKQLEIQKGILYVISGGDPKHLNVVAPEFIEGLKGTALKLFEFTKNTTVGLVGGAWRLGKAAVTGTAKGIGTAAGWTANKALDLAVWSGDKLSGVAKGLTKRYTDIYLSGGTEPILTAAAQQAGEVCYEDGTKPLSSYTIKNALYWADTEQNKKLNRVGQIAISTEQVPLLVDKDGKPLNRFATKLGAIANIASAKSLGALKWTGGKVLDLGKLTANGVMGLIGNVAGFIGGPVLNALKAVTVRAFKGKNPYVDVYSYHQAQKKEDGKELLGNPLLTGTGIRDGEYVFNDGSRVTSAYKIKIPVLSAKDNNTLVTDEDITSGLFTIDADGNREDLTAFAGKSLAGKALSLLGSATFGLSKKIVGTSWKALKAVGKGIKAGAGGLAELLGMGNDFLTKPMNFLKSVFKARQYINRDDLEQVVGYRLDMIYAHIAGKPMPKLVLESDAKDVEAEVAKEGEKKQKKQFQWFGIRDKLLIRRLKKAGVKIDDVDYDLLTDPTISQKEKTEYAKEMMKDSGIDPDEKKKSFGSKLLDKFKFADKDFGKNMALFKKDLFSAGKDIADDFKKRQEEDTKNKEDLKQKIATTAKLAAGYAKVISNLTKRRMTALPLDAIQQLAGGNTTVLKRGLGSVAFAGIGDDTFCVEVATYILSTITNPDGTINYDKVRKINLVLMKAKLTTNAATSLVDKLLSKFKLKRKGSYEDQQEREKEDEARREKKKKEKEEAATKKKGGLFSRMAGLFRKGGAAGAAAAAGGGIGDAIQTGADAVSAAADIKDLAGGGKAAKAAGTAAKAAKVGMMGRVGSMAATAGKALLGVGTSLIGPIGSFIVSNPIGWAVGAVLLAGAVGYGAWCLFSDSDEVELWRDTRLEAYGLPTGEAYEDEIEDLEEETLEILDGERIPFTNDELMKWARKFGIITDEAGPEEKLDTGKGSISLDPVMMTKFFTTWYNKRFLPIYSAYVKMMREATDAGVGDDPDPDDLNEEQQKPLMDAFKKVCSTINGEKETSLLVPTFDGYVKAMESGLDLSSKDSESEGGESDEEYLSKRDEELKAEAEANGKTIVKDDEFSKKSFKDVMSDMLRNAGDSVADTWDAITNPYDTMQNLFESVGEGAFRDAWYTAIGVKRTDKRIVRAIDWLDETYLEYFETKSGSRVLSEDDLDEFVERLDLRTNNNDANDQDGGSKLTAAARKGKMRTYIREYINKRFIPVWQARYAIIRKYSETKPGDDLDINDIPESKFSAAIKGITASVKSIKQNCPEFDDLTPNKAGFTKWMDRVAAATGADKFDSETQAVSDVDQDKVKEFESGINANKKEGFWGNLRNKMAQMASDAIAMISSDGDTNVAENALIWVLELGAKAGKLSKLEEIKAKAYGFRLDDVAMMRNMETRENEIYTKQKDPYTEEDLHALGTAMKIIPVPTESTKLTEETYKASKKYFVTWYAKRFQAVFSYIVQIAHAILKVNDSETPGLPDLNILSNDQKKQFEAMLDKAIGKLIGEYPSIMKYNATKRGLERWLANDALELGLMPDAARLKAIEDQRKMEEQAAKRNKYRYGTRTFGGPAQPDTTNANNSSNPPPTSTNSAGSNQNPTSVGSMVNATGSPSFVGDGASIISSLNTAAIAAAPITDGGNGDLGSYVKEFESGKRGSTAIGHDRTGGTSYGTYQIAAKTGTLARFLKFAQAEGEFGSQLASAMAKAGSLNTGSTAGAAPDVWRKFAELNPAAMRALEHKFIKKTHYDVALQLIKNPDIRKLIESDRGLQEALWSTAVQHGGGGAASIFSKTYKPGITAADWLKAIYASRSTKFGSSTADVRRSVLNRYKRELPIMLGLSGVAPSSEGSADASQNTQSASGASAPSDGTAQAPEASADAKTADSATAGSTSDSSSSASATAAASAASTPTSSTTTTSATGTVSNAAASVAAVVQSNMAQMNTPTTLSGASSSTPITAINNPNTVAASNQRNESIPVLKNIEAILSEIRDVIKSNTTQGGSATVSGGIDYDKMAEAVSSGVKKGTPINELANMLFKLSTPATMEIVSALSNMAATLKSMNSAPSIDTAKQTY